MPFIMDYPRVVIVKGKVYIGGGWALSLRERQTVMVCDPQQDTWFKLPPYQYTQFALAVVNDQLVLVGGEDETTWKDTAMLGVWNEQSQTWTNPFPPMPTARHLPSVVTHDNRWLVVVGGKLELEDSLVGTVTANVEILDTTLGQWYHGAPAPQPCQTASTATVGNMCYAIGGFTKGDSSSSKVFSMCLDDLISQAVPQPASVIVPPTQSTSPLETIPHTPHTPSTLPWETLYDTPLPLSTALALNGALLAIGGLENGTRASKAIYLYQPSSKKWVKAGELPTVRATCACIVLTSQEILVAGGFGSIPGGVTDRVEVATLQ